MSIDKEDDSFLWKLLLVIHKGVDNDNPGHNVWVSASNIQLLRPIPVIRSIPVRECIPWIELCVYFFGLICIYFPGFNLPVPTGRLTPAASSIFNIVSSVTLLSPWGAGFFFFCCCCCCCCCFSLCFDQAILKGFTQSHCQIAVQTIVLDRFVFKLRQRSSVLYRKMKVTFQTLLSLL